MSNLSKIRASMGLTQKQMAEWLAVSRSLYSMAETGRRSLPTAAYLKLADWELRKTNDKMERPLPERFLKWEASFCKELAEELEYKKLLRQRELQTMQQQYQNCLAKLETAQLAGTAAIEGTDGERDGLWAAVTEAEAVQELKTCTPIHQQLLEIEIEGLEKMLAALAKNKAA